MFLLEIQTTVGCNMLDKLVELCKNDLVSTIDNDNDNDEFYWLI